MLRRFVFIIFISCAFLSTPVQTAVPFPDSAASWVNTFSIWDWSHGGPPLKILMRVENYCMDGIDTTLNGNIYTQIRFCNGSYKGGLRDDNGKIYFCPKDSTQEYLLYDFTVNPGDTVRNVYVEVMNTSAMLNDFIIGHNSIDTISINGIDRRRILVEGSYWIEGIGNTQGLFLEPWINVSNYILELNCMSYKDTILYPAISIGACPLNVAINEVESVIYSAYPNPTAEKIIVRADVFFNSSNVTILNVFGQQVHPPLSFMDNSVSIDFQNISTGIYFFTAYSKAGNINLKIIRQ